MTWRIVARFPRPSGETNGKRYYSLGEIQKYTEAGEEKTRQRYGKGTSSVEPVTPPPATAPCLLVLPPTPRLSP